MKRTLSILLAVLLVLAVMPAVNAETAADDPFFGRFDEPVKLRIVKDSADEPGVWTWEDNAWTQEWKDRFNIEIELMWNTGTTEEYNTKFAMAMLTGDLPDIMKVNSKQFKELYESGYLMDLTEAYDQYIYPFLKEEVIEKQEAAVLESAFIDGRRYAIPMASFATNTRTIMIRRDYREAVGAELPTTVEEVVELGKKFVDEGLTKYALVLQQNVTGDGYTDMQAIANGFGAYPGIWVEDAEGKLVYSSTTEGMKKTLDLYKDLYDNGYIQPTFATEVGDNVTAYISNGEVGILPSDFWVATWPLPLTDEEGDVIEWDMVPVVPSETNDDFHVQGSGSMADISYVVINAQCENVVAALRTFNHTCSVISDPALKETERFHTVKMEDGTDLSVHMQNPSITYWSVPHVNMMTSKAVMDARAGDMDALLPQPHFQQQYDNVMAYEEAVAAGNKDGIKANWSMYKLFGGEESLFYCFYKNYIAGNYIWDARTSTTENYERLWGTLKQYENTFYVNYISGTEETTFEEFVEEWNTMGGQLLTDELNADK